MTSRSCTKCFVTKKSLSAFPRDDSMSNHFDNFISCCLVPGHRLVGLEGHYIERGGHIVLKARRCQEVVMPAEPDKVLVSCGVVVLHCIPRKREAGNRSVVDKL